MIIVFEQLSLLFIIIFIGYLIKRFSVIDNKGQENISNLIIYITLPALIIISMQYDFTLDRLKLIKNTFIIAFIIYLVMIFTSQFIMKIFSLKERKDKKIYQFMIIFANTAFMGYPVIEIIFGEEGIFLAAIYNLVLNIMLWTVGIFIINEADEATGFNLNYKALLNPGILAVIVGLLLFLFSVELPLIVEDILEMMGGLTTPLALLVIGSALAEIKIKYVFGNFNLWKIVFLRQLIFPLLVFLIMIQFNFDRLVLGVNVVLTGMPVAAVTAIFAQKYNANFKLASEGVFLSTLLSFITIPLLILIL